MPKIRYYALRLREYPLRRLRKVEDDRPQVFIAITVGLHDTIRVRCGTHYLMRKVSSVLVTLDVIVILITTID
jgi:hypothetical protein